MYSLKKVISIFWTYAKNYKKRLWLTFFILFIATLGVICLGQGMKKFVQIYLNQDKYLFGYAPVFVSVGIIVLGFFTYSRIYYVLWISERIVSDMRLDLFKKLINAPLYFLEELRTGNILSTMSADLQVIQSSLGGLMSLFMRNFLIVVGTLFMMIRTSLRLSCYVFACFFVIFYPVVLFAIRIKRASYHQQDAMGELNSYMEERLDHVKTVHIFTKEEIEIENVKRLNQNVFSHAMKTTKERSWLATCTFILAFISIFILLVIGRLELQVGQLNGIDLGTFFISMGGFCMGVASFGNVAGDVNRTLGAYQRFIQILEKIPSFSSAIHTKSLKNQRGIIAFHQIHFAYHNNPSHRVLKNINFSVHPGECVALVGPSGSGKTTLMNLLLKLYEPQSGHIYIEGIDTKELSAKDIRTHIAFIAQEPTLFSGTFYENLVYGCEDISMDIIEDVVRLTHLEEIIEPLPKGIHTYIGKKGFSLSGGQKQRLAIARAMLRKSSILVMDEPHNFLDVRNQTIVEKCLRKKTALIIAHHLQTVIKADKIIVLSKGEIEAVGTHAELMMSNEFYQGFAKWELASIS